MTQKFRTIVADPPWPYGGFVHGRLPGWRDRAEQISEVTAKSMPFPTMPVEDIAALPIGEWAATDGAALFLWTTNRYLPDAFGVVRAWGFDYRQTLVWDKGGNASPFGGSVAPNRAEYLLVGRRGEHRWTGRMKSPIVAVNRTRHSRKPDVFLDHIEQVSPGPYLELFARRSRLGWDYWGDESLQTVELAA